MRRIFGIFCCCVIQWAVALNGALCDSSLYIDTNVDTNISLTENTRLWNYGTINGTIQTNGHDLDV
jgi:inorganic pyrophosphatase